MGFSIREILQKRGNPDPKGEGLSISDPQFSLQRTHVGEINAVTENGKAIVDIKEQKVVKGQKPHQSEIIRNKVGRIIVDVNDPIFH